MTADATTWLVLAVAVVFAGVSKGGFGSGAAFAGAALMALVMPPATALAIMLPLLMLIDLVTLRPYWRRWRWPEARLLVLGALPGVAVGAWIFGQVDADVLRLLIGAIALAFVAWQLSVALGLVVPDHRAVPVWGGLLAGMVAGVTSFVSHAGGPAAAVYLLARRLDKTAFQATTVLVFGLINVVKVAAYAGLGLFTPATLSTGLVLVPFALLGAWIGVKAHFLISERVFFTLTYVLLTITGVKLILDGVAG